MGKTRARQQSLKKGDYAPEGVESRTGDGALCFMIHGDGAFTGQVFIRFYSLRREGRNMTLASGISLMLVS